MNVKFKNFGEIDNTAFDIKDITFFTGKSVSKSYVMKFLYAYYEAVYLSVHDNTLLNPNYYSSYEKKFIYFFKNILQSIFENLSQINNSFEVDIEDTKVVYNNSLTIENVDFINIYKPIFIQTPLILELQSFLPTEEFLTPYHISSLLQELNRRDYSFISDEEDNFVNKIKKATSDIIGGNIFKEGREFLFESKDGKKFNIANTSSAVKSIGLLQYLVTNKNIKENSIIFWEEPEAHLQEEYQLKMVDLFIELMRNGVKVTFTTNSSAIIDYIKTKSDETVNRVSII